MKWPLLDLLSIIYSTWLYRVSFPIHSHMAGSEYLRDLRSSRVTCKKKSSYLSFYSNRNLTNTPTNIFESVLTYDCSVFIKSSQKCDLIRAYLGNTWICILGHGHSNLALEQTISCVPLRWELSHCQHLSQSKCKKGTEQKMVTEALWFQAP